MSEFDHIHSKTRKRFIAAGFLVAFLIDLIPFPSVIDGWLPECTAMLLLYWTLYQPQTIGIGVAFFMGLLMDIGIGSPLGQHALAYIASVYLIEQNRRQISIYPYGGQALSVGGALFVGQLIIIVIHFFEMHQFAGWGLLISPVIGALLWPLLNKLMLFLTQLHRI